MGNDGKKTLTPKLRFPEFREPWTETEIAPYLQECSSRVAAPTDLPIYTSSRAGLKPQEDYYGGRTLINEGEYGVVPPDCFVFRHMSDDGVFAFHLNETGRDIAVSKEYPVFRAVGVNRHFLLVKLNHSPDFKAFALSQKAGGTRTRLYFSKLRTWKTPLPSPAEQQKIADCLTSLDELIAAQGRKVEALRAHKKGLMQQLFPREGEALPRLRLPEFRNAGEWKEKRLDVISDFQTGGTPSKSNPAFWNGSIPWVSAKDMKRMVLDDTEDHITDAAVENGAKVVPAGTVLILTRGMTLLKDIPICLLSRPMALNQDVRALRPSNGFDGLFLAYMLVGKKERIRRMVDIAGHGTGRLNTDRLKGLDLMFPSPAEQQRIADRLSSLDTRLNAEFRKLDALKLHKRGLMQQLFPSLKGD